MCTRSLSHTLTHFFSLPHRLRNSSVLPLAPGWLCYLAPEIVRLVRPDMFSDELPFTYYSDVFAFGTLWFELLVGEWPFHCGREGSHPAETLIWLVGNYRKPPLPEVLFYLYTLFYDIFW